MPRRCARLTPRVHSRIQTPAKGLNPRPLLLEPGPANLGNARRCLVGVRVGVGHETHLSAKLRGDLGERLTPIDDQRDGVRFSLVRQRSRGTVTRTVCPRAIRRGLNRVPAGT